MTNYQNSKKIVREYFESLEQAQVGEISKVFDTYMSEDYDWKCVFPFRDTNTKNDAVNLFWEPFKLSLSRMQRRQDIFIAGTNEIDGDEWVMSMGHFMGLFDQDWLNIPRTRKMINLRYAEFHCVKDNKITKSGLFIDIVGFMLQAGINPLPPQTGNYFVYPGPRNHDGLLFDEVPVEDGIATAALVKKMVNDLTALKERGAMGCPPEVLAQSWDTDMIWYGPGGIGASYTIPRYQEQHQLPFRNNLTGKKFNGHVCRFAEGNFACFFGWPNLTNTPSGGFLGLPGGNVSANMQVVDVYYRKGDKLSENWVLIDIPYWLSQQGVNILERTTSIVNPSYDK